MEGEAVYWSVCEGGLGGGRGVGGGLQCLVHSGNYSLGNEFRIAEAF